MSFSHRVLAPGLSAILLVLATSPASAQVVINELVQDNRTNGNSNVADTGEFIELYNAGGSTVDLSTWSLRVIDLDSGGELFSIPLNTNPMLAAGDYYVIGNSSGLDPALLDFDTQISDFLENDNNLYELRDGNGDLVDALGVQLTFDPQYDFVTSDQLAQIGGGGWSQLLTTIETPQSYGRYRDGEDTNINGRDFGVIRSTPGASNTLPDVANAIPDVDGLGLSPGANVPGFSYSFVGPKVVDPTAAGTYIKHALPSRSPQGGNAIVAWDQTGGGNMVASDSLVTSFDIWAWIDTEPLNVSTGDFEWDVTTYGIGTTDAFFGSPDPTAIFTTAAETSNGNTGVGWVYLREETTNFESLMLIDFNDGGDSLPTGADWTVLETIDLTSSPSDWHRLSVDYDPATGEVVARFDSQVFTHTITTNMVGTFYVGFREALSGGVPAVVGPPIFDFYEDAAATADYDGDGDIDGRDFLLWQRGQSPDPFSAGDLALWQAQYGMGSLAASIVIPEPSVGVLALAFCGVLSAARCRRNG